MKGSVRLPHGGGVVSEGVLFERVRRELERKGNIREGAVKAERSVIGTRRSSCVCKLEGRFVVEHEAVMRTRDKKRQERRMINRSHDRGRSDAATRLVLSVALRGSLHWSDVRLEVCVLLRSC